jgi:hypothetical protein
MSEGSETDPLAKARAIMKRQALDAGQRIIERWHDHPSGLFCPRSCPEGNADWDGKGLAIDHWTSPQETL